MADSSFTGPPSEGTARTFVGGLGVPRGPATWQDREEAGAVALVPSCSARFLYACESAAAAAALCH